MASRVLEDLNELVRACYPKDQDEALELWHDIKPIRFGTRLQWTVAIEYELAFYSIPSDVPYLAVLRVDHYIATTAPAAVDFGSKGPPVFTVDLFSARWVAAPRLPAVIGPEFNVAGGYTPHQILDVEEFLLFRGGNETALRADMPANPSADARFFMTLVYGYLLGPKVADKLGSGETIVATT